eukprot:2833929-Pleurochrysis_carterae.AAC.1
MACCPFSAHVDVTTVSLTVSECLERVNALTLQRFEGMPGRYNHCNVTTSSQKTSSIIIIGTVKEFRGRAKDAAKKANLVTGLKPRSGRKEGEEEGREGGGGGTEVGRGGRGSEQCTDEASEPVEKKGEEEKGEKKVCEARGREGERHAHRAVPILVVLSVVHPAVLAHAAEVCKEHVDGEIVRRGSLLQPATNITTRAP